jgi:hypothetical protein
MMVLQSFKSPFTNSSHVKFCIRLPLFLLPDQLITPLRIGASGGGGICEMGSPVHVVPAYTGSGEGSAHFGSYVRSLPPHFLQVAVSRT